MEQLLLAGAGVAMLGAAFVLGVLFGRKNKAKVEKTVATVAPVVDDLKRIVVKKIG